MTATTTTKEFNKYCGDARDGFTVVQEGSGQRAGGRLSRCVGVSWETLLGLGEDGGYWWVSYSSVNGYLVQEIKKREGFRLLMEPEFANVCFWYIPPSLKNLPDSPELYQKLHTVAPVVKERMMKTGSMMVGYQPHGDKPNFFRMVVISPQVSRQDMDFVLDEIHCLGKDL